MLIDQVSQSISQMSDDELYDRIKELRQARRIKTPIKRKAKKPANKTKLMKALDSLSPEELLEIMAKLED